MATIEPVTELDARYSSPGATPTSWEEARDRLADAEVFWLSTVRPGGHPHVTPVLAVWAGDALIFTTGPAERKARNLTENPHCVLTTGSNALGEGLDLVVEGDAVQVGDEAKLQGIADIYEAKYGSDWRFTVRDGAFHRERNTATVYEVAPSTAYAFAKGNFAHTRYRF